MIVSRRQWELSMQVAIVGVQITKDVKDQRAAMLGAGIVGSSIQIASVDALHIVKHVKDVLEKAKSMSGHAGIENAEMQHAFYSQQEILLSQQEIAVSATFYAVSAKF